MTAIKIVFIDIFQYAADLIRKDISNPCFYGNVINKAKKFNSGFSLLKHR